MGRESRDTTLCRMIWGYNPMQDDRSDFAQSLQSSCMGLYPQRGFSSLHAPSVFITSSFSTSFNAPPPHKRGAGRLVSSLHAALFEHYTTLSPISHHYTTLSQISHHHTPLSPTSRHYTTLSPMKSSLRAPFQVCPSLPPPPPPPSLLSLSPSISIYLSRSALSLCSLPPSL